MMEEQPFPHAQNFTYLNMLDILKEIDFSIIIYQYLHFRKEEVIETSHNF